MKKRKMIKSLIAITLSAMMMTGCGSATVQTQQQINSGANVSMFVCVEEAALWKIVYHRETKVMYAVSYYLENCGNFTVLVNADGTPMVWDDGQ